MFHVGNVARQLRVLSAFAVAVGVGGAVLGSSAGTAAASSKPIKIGIVYDGSGPDESSDIGNEVGLTAWVKWVDAHGGVTGRQVDLIAENDGSNTTTAVSDARKLVATDVAAIVPALATAPSIVKVVDTAKIPAIGGIEDTITWSTTPYWFATGTDPGQYTFDIMGMGYPKDKKTAIFYQAGSSSASETLPIFEGAAKLDGGTLVGTYAISNTAATYTGQCLAAKSAGAQEVLWDMTPATTIRIGPACAAQGFKPQYVAPDQVVNLTSLKTPALYGTDVAYSNAPYYGTPKEYAGLKDYDAAMKKYHKSFMKSPFYGENNILGWTAGLLLADAVKAAHVKKSATVTAADVLKGLYSLHGVTLTGLSGPLTYPKTGHYSFSCFFTGKVEAGKFKAVTIKPDCPTPKTLKALAG